MIAIVHSICCTLAVHACDCTLRAHRKGCLVRVLCTTSYHWSVQPTGRLLSSRSCLQTALRTPCIAHNSFLDG